MTVIKQQLRWFVCMALVLLAACGQVPETASVSAFTSVAEKTQILPGSKGDRSHLIDFEVALLRLCRARADNRGQTPPS